MTLPLQTFRVSVDYTFAAAGASPTIAEIIAALNTMLVAEASLGASWGVSAFSAGANNTLEIKRLGSPGGALGAVRGLIFGGTNAPNANAVGVGVSTTANLMYAGIAEAAGIGQAGPDASYTAGAPYTTTNSKKWSGAGACGSSTALTAAGGLRTFMVDCDRGCALFISDAAITISIFIGEWVERLSDNAGIFVCMTCGTTPATQTSYGTLSASSSWLVPGQDITSWAGNALCAWNDGTNQNALTRMMITGRTSDSLLGTGRGTLVPIVMSNKTQAAAADSSSEFGVLRQLRYGPYCNNKISVADATPAIVCYGVSGGKLLLRAGIYFDVAQ